MAQTLHRAQSKPQIAIALRTMRELGSNVELARTCGAHADYLERSDGPTAELVQHVQRVRDRAELAGPG